MDRIERLILTADIRHKLRSEEPFVYNGMKYLYNKDRRFLHFWAKQGTFFGMGTLRQFKNESHAMEFIIRSANEKEKN